LLAVAVEGSSTVDSTNVIDSAVSVAFCVGDAATVVVVVVIDVATFVANAIAVTTVAATDDTATAVSAAAFEEVVDNAVKCGASEFVSVSVSVPVSVFVIGAGADPVVEDTGAAVVGTAEGTALDGANDGAGPRFSSIEERIPRSRLCAAMAASFIRWI